MNAPRFTMRKLAFFVAAAYAPGAFAAQAARIEFATNEPVIVSADGRERPARKGEAIVPGERVLTRSGRAQLAFTDGAFVSLQPNSDFGVTEYNFNGANDGKEKSVLSLVKGALRTITGLIGRSKRDAYVMQTPTATIGIRGTGGRIEVNERGTFVAGTSGTWFMSTPGGTIDIPSGANGFAGPNRNEPPKLSDTTPNTPPLGAPSAEFVVSDQVNSSGGSILGPTAFMADGPGYTVLHVSSLDGTAYKAPVTTAKFVSGVTLESFVDASSNLVAQGSTAVVESGNDGIVGWGRWASGQYSVNGTPQTALNGNQGLAYVVGLPTAVMPGVGSATYSLLGATKPTEMAGGLAAGTFSLNLLSIDFAMHYLTINFDVAIGPYGFNAQTSANPIGINNTFTSALTVTGSGGACTGACGGSLEGAFYGEGAARMGIAYRLQDFMIGKVVTGTAAFTRNP
ncbi:MAG TPA: FecR family protein [Rhodocyclaceae bacterium]|nr:FecR family protein [Rhodocyclaceae bacterium]